MKKVILIIGLVLVLISITNALPFFEHSNNISFGNNQQTTLQLGMKINISTTFYLTNFTFASGWSGDACKLYNDAGSVTIASGTISGLVCQINPPVLLNQSDGYKLVGYKIGGTSFEHKYVNANNPPLDDTYFVWQNDCYGNDGAITSKSGTWRSVQTISGEVYEGGGPSPSLTINHNLVNNTINYNGTSFNITYNGTLSDHTTDIFNCTVYDGTSDNSQLNVNLTKLQNLNVNFPDYEGWKLFNITCENDENSDVTTTYYYQIDNIEPGIEILSNFVNESNLIKDSTLIFEFNVTDSNLDGYFVEWYETDEVTLIQNYSAEGLTTTSAYNLSTYVLSDTGNNFSIKIGAWDSHNPIEGKVKPLHWYNSENTIYAEGFILEGAVKEEQTYFYLSENKYKLKVTFEEDKNLHTFNLSKSNYIRYLDYTEYYGHFIYVDYPNKIFRYLDFEGENIESVDVEDIGSKYKIIVKLKNQSDELEFRSIGDLNYKEEIYFYNVVSQDTQYLSELPGIAQDLEDVLEAIEMIGYILIWIFVTASSLVLMINYNYVIGQLFWFMAYMFDFLLIGKLYEGIGLPSGGFLGFFYGMLYIGLTAWLIVKLFIPTMIKTKTRR